MLKRCVPVLIVVLLTIISLTVHAQDNENGFIFEFGHRGFADGELNNVLGIAVDNQGNIIVADSLNNRIQTFNASGEFQFAFGEFGSVEGQFNFPSDVTIAPDQNLIVTDSGNNRIQVFDSSGNYLFSIGSEGTGLGQFNAPYRTATDSDGKIYVTDQLNHRIQVFDPQGYFIFAFGEYGTEDGQFVNPASIAINSAGEIIVAESDGHRIQIFDQGGNFQLSFGVEGRSEGRFKRLIDVTVDAEDNIVVLGVENERVQFFDSSGNYLSSLKGIGAEFRDPSNFGIQPPLSISLDRTGNLYISRLWSIVVFEAPPLTPIDSLGATRADSQSEFLIGVPADFGTCRFGFSGNSFEFAGELADLWPIHDVAIDTSGNFLIASPHRRGVLIVDPFGNIVNTFSYAESNLDSGTNSLQIAASPDGNIVVADTAADVKPIMTFNYEGELISSFGEVGTDAGQLEYYGGSRTNFADLVVDSTGRIIISDNGTRVQVFDADGNLLFGLNGADDDQTFLAIDDLAVDNADNIIVADRDSNQVHVFDSAGNWQSTITIDNRPDTGTETNPQLAVTVASNGYMVVADGSNSRMLVYDNNHTLVGSVGRDNSDFDGIAFSSPDEIVMTPDGDIVVLDAETAVRNGELEFLRSGEDIIVINGFNLED